MRIKPGQVLNPKGRPKGCKGKRTTLRHTATSISEAYNKLTSFSREELELHAKASDTPILEALVATALLDDIKNKNLNNFNHILLRMIGPVPIITKGELTGMDGAPFIPPQILIQPVSPPQLPIPVEQITEVPQS